MPDRASLLGALGVIVLVFAMPWVSAWGPDVSLFGFPWAAFVPLLLVPGLLVVLARARDDDDDGAGR